jgi:thioredoxin reductase (NADPH)
VVRPAPAVKFGAEIPSTQEVVALEPAGSARVLRFNDGSAFYGTARDSRSMDKPSLPPPRGRFYGRGCGRSSHRRNKGARPP